MRKYITIVIIIAFACFAVWVFDTLRTPHNPDGSPRGLSYKTTTLLIEGFELTLEIADTPAKQSLGLSGRKSLAADEGMLFIFGKAGLHGFWMKDMLFSIDIGWLDKDFCLVYVARGVRPESYPTVYVPSSPAWYAIEANAGFFSSHNLKKGTCLVKPAL